MSISALIPTYNRQKQVMRAIDSVIAQTMLVDEIIIVDDGSTDGTAEAIRSRYGSGVTLIQQENAGVSSARNRGIREAHGEWIALLDSDDIWLPTKIERQLEALTILGEEFGVCFTDCLYEGNPGMKLSVFQEAGFSQALRFGPLQDPAKYMVSGIGPVWTPSLLIRRSLFDKIDGFDEALVIKEDADVILQLSFKTRFCFVSEPLVRIDRTPSHSGGLSELYNEKDDRKYENLKRVYTKWLTMPQVAGTNYERPIRDSLRSTFYDSAECKFHQLRVRPALEELGRLREIGDSYALIVVTLFRRKISKLLRNSNRIQSR